MLATIIDNAASLLPLVWPLQQSVAVNPLEDLTRLSIDDANRELDDATVADEAVPAATEAVP